MHEPGDPARDQGPPPLGQALTQGEMDRSREEPSASIRPEQQGALGTCAGTRPRRLMTYLYRGTRIRLVP